MKTVDAGERMSALLLAAMVLCLAGCWTAPTANVQPRGEPRLIQAGIAVESVKDPATVESLDATQQMLVLKFSDGSAARIKAGTRVANFHRIQVGDTVRVTVAEALDVYVLENGRSSGAGGATEDVHANARLLDVDPSYRLLTLQYSNGHAETFKVGLDVKLLQMEAGDDVVVRTIEAVALRVLQQGSRSR